MGITTVSKGLLCCVGPCYISKVLILGLFISFGSLHVTFRCNESLVHKTDGDHYRKLTKLIVLESSQNVISTKQGNT